MRNSQTAEQLADAYVVLEKVYGNLDDSERVMEMISLDTSVQFEAVRQAYVRHYKRTYATRAHVLPGLFAENGAAPLGHRLVACRLAGLHHYAAKT